MILNALNWPQKIPTKIKLYSTHVVCFAEPAYIQQSGDKTIILSPSVASAQLTESRVYIRQAVVFSFQPSLSEIGRSLSCQLGFFANCPLYSC